MTSPTAVSVALHIAMEVRANVASGLDLIDVSGNVVTFEERATHERIMVTVQTVYQPTQDTAWDGPNLDEG